MTFEDLEQFIDEMDLLFSKRKDVDYSQREVIFARTIKLGEEFGELCDQVLAFVGDQRKNKLMENGTQELPGEFADVVIVAFLLAKAMDIDMRQALEQKMQKIREKHSKQLP